MISRLGSAISALFRRTAPDPFVIAVLLTLLTVLIALAIGFPSGPGEARVGVGARLLALLSAWGVEGGLWELLAFSMQMALILVTGHALAASRPVRVALGAIANLPRSGPAAAATVAAAACATSLLNWGLCLIVGALLAREVGRSMARRGIPVHYPLLAAAGYTGMMVWHGGLSGSSPLTMSTVGNAAKVIPADLIAHLAGEGASDPAAPLIGLDRTLGSPMNLFITGGLLVVTPLLCYFLSPRRAGECAPMPEGALSSPPAAAHEPQAERAGALPEWLERSPFISLLLATALLIALARFIVTRGVAGIGLNEVNLAMLALGLLLHGSPRSYAAAAEEAARGCAGIIIQFPLYAGIIAMMKASGLVRVFADWFIAAGNDTTIPLYSFISACIVNIFVPSGGGQWAIQGPIALRAGIDAGIDPAKMVMSVAYGDQLTNMLQPFWALPLLAITGVKARDIVGYTALVMLAAGVWISLGLLVF